jgi:hypothetical protein
MHRTIALALLLLAETDGNAVPAQDNAPDAARAVDSTETDTDSAEKINFYRQRLQDHRLFTADRPDRPCHLVETPLMRFDNPVSRIGDGMLFLWTDNVRPVAALKSYYNLPNGTWGRTFVSLATQPLELRVDDQPVWTPKSGSVEFKVLPDASSPAEKPGARLVQMRTIAREFQVVDNWGVKNPTDWQLRLLPAPLYRYEAPGEGVVDGAIFGYALSGPEALLLLEAHQTDAGLEWRYAAARCTRFQVTFSRREAQLTAFARLDAWPSTETYFHVALPMTGYRFGNPFGKGTGSIDAKGANR